MRFVGVVLIALFAGLLIQNAHADINEPKVEPENLNSISEPETQVDETIVKPADVDQSDTEVVPSTEDKESSDVANDEPQVHSDNLKESAEETKDQAVVDEETPAEETEVEVTDESKVQVSEENVSSVEEPEDLKLEIDAEPATQKDQAVTDGANHAEESEVQSINDESEVQENEKVPSVDDPEEEIKLENPDEKDTGVQSVNDEYEVQENEEVSSVEDPEEEIKLEPEEPSVEEKKDPALIDEDIPAEELPSVEIKIKLETEVEPSIEHVAISTDQPVQDIEDQSSQANIEEPETQADIVEESEPEVLENTHSNTLLAELEARVSSLEAGQEELKKLEPDFDESMEFLAARILRVELQHQAILLELETIKNQTVSNQAKQLGAMAVEKASEQLQAAKNISLLVAERVRAEVPIILAEMEVQASDMKQQALVMKKQASLVVKEQYEIGKVQVTQFHKVLSVKMEDTGVPKKHAPKFSMAVLGFMGVCILMVVSIILVQFFKLIMKAICFLLCCSCCRKKTKKGRKRKEKTH